MPSQKIWMSWSSGKDSAYALYQLLKQPDHFQVTGLLTTVTNTFDRVSLHGVRRELLEEQAKQLSLPLHVAYIPYPASNEIYENAMRQMVDQALAEGVTGLAFGDIFLQNVKEYREKQWKETGIQPLFPLWNLNSSVLANEMVSSEIKAIITAVDTQKLNESFSGRAFDQNLLGDLPKEVDACGENGEFHSFVYDMPYFKNPIPIQIGQKINRDGYAFTDILLKK